MTDVTVAILHPPTGPDAGPLERILAEARADLAERHRRAFARAGASHVHVASDPPGEHGSFGARLRTLAAGLDGGGLVVLGSGAVPLLSGADRRRFVATAASTSPASLANNRYSADIVAIACARSVLLGSGGRAAVPDLATDNALPRWLAESAGVPVADLASHWRTGVDIDGPLDLLLLGGSWTDPLPNDLAAPVRERLRAVRRLVADPRGELVVAGRISLDSLRWLARHGAARTRALVEERGLRTGVKGQRAPASVLGALLERDGPEALGTILSRLGDAAIVDSRVLMAHRHGPEEASWPTPEDRYASDLLLHARIADPWLRALTRSAAEAPIPVVLGAHTLVGPGLRLALTTRLDPASVDDARRAGGLGGSRYGRSRP